MKKYLIIGLLLIAIIVAFLVFSISIEDTTPVPVADEKIEVPADKDLLESDSEPIPDFTLPDVDGNQVSALAEVAKHRLTIIDFWASWCGPCRAEMPSMVKVYENYKDKGLGIIGVSLDEERNSWLNAIEKMKMTWLQLSDLQGWNCSAARLFNVNSIPATLFVNSKGQVVAINLRGEALKMFISKALK